MRVQPVPPGLSTTQRLLARSWNSRPKGERSSQAHLERILASKASSESIGYRYEQNCLRKVSIELSFYPRREQRTRLEVICASAGFARVLPLHFSRDFLKVTYRYSVLQAFLKEKLAERVFAQVSKRQEDRRRLMFYHTWTILTSKTRQSFFFTSDLIRDLKALNSQFKLEPPLCVRQSAESEIQKLINPEVQLSPGSSSTCEYAPALPSSKNAPPKLVIKNRVSSEISPRKSKLEGFTPKDSKKMRIAPLKNLKIEIPRDEEEARLDQLHRSRFMRRKETSEVNLSDSQARKPLKLPSFAQIRSSSQRKLQTLEAARVLHKTSEANRLKRTQKLFGTSRTALPVKKLAKLGQTNSYEQNKISISSAFHFAFSKCKTKKV